ncbi:XdhC family protein [Oceanimonas doudoroffii]|uniref:Isoquinoline 1-oxidoreductase n=1 Tax=Oceanimonas doudoroffii TaxID=84158 RepID=A0A233RAZ2_9GAMM|nr:XdhC/CoxI family protein [Oceanimonas doudoroffii]OXY80557.1 isoquinoline 1-oxidoreductase [Oceanimonas doudoroffii]
MSNQLSTLLAQWYSQRSQAEWVLGTVYQTEGSSYRKAGAMMLFSSLGQQLGMLSGGCLESDIQLHARKVMQTGSAMTLRYDGNDEDDLSFQLGIGCGGVVYVLLQPVTAANDYLGLEQVHQALSARQRGVYYQRIPETNGRVEGRFLLSEAVSSNSFHIKGRLIRDGDEQWLETPIVPEPHLLIVGGGLDARSVSAMAHTLGWRVSIWDPRPANARAEFFMSAHEILRVPADTLTHFVSARRVDAAVLMAHNISLDGAALRALHQTPLRYLAMLGPRHRRDQVLEWAGLSIDDINIPLAGPVGLDIGGELPESIALAMLAECHAVLAGGSARSLSGVL